MKKGFTIIELLIVITIVGIISTVLYSQASFFIKIYEDYQIESKFERYGKYFYNELSKLEKLKLTMVFEDKVITGNNVDKLEPIYIPNSESSSTEDIEKIKLFWGIKNPSVTDEIFLSRIFVYTKNNKYRFNGDTIIDYKTFTFVYINDPVIAKKLRNESYRRNFFNSHFIDENSSYISIKVKPDINATNTWYKEKNAIKMFRINTFDIVLNTLKTIDNRLDESRRRINEWANIQANYNAYKSLYTSGNNLDLDYFITCKSDSGKCEDDSEVDSTRTLLANDDGNDESLNGGVNYKNIGNYNIDTLPSSYGFVLFNSDGFSLFSTSYSTTSNAGEITEIDKDNDEISFKAQKLAVVQRGFNTNIDDSYATVSKAMSSLIVEKTNLFGYSVYFTNKPGAKLGLVNKEMDENKTKKLDVNFPKADGKSSAPYYANIVTPLPNGEILVKRLFVSSY